MKNKPTHVKNEESLASYEGKLDRAAERVAKAAERMSEATRHVVRVSMTLKRAMDEEKYYKRQRAEVLRCMERGEPFRKARKPRLEKGMRKIQLDD